MNNDKTPGAWSRALSKLAGTMRAITSGRTPSGPTALADDSPQFLEAQHEQRKRFEARMSDGSTLRAVTPRGFMNRQAKRSASRRRSRALGREISENREALTAVNMAWMRADAARQTFNTFYTGPAFRRDELR